MNLIQGKILIYIFFLWFGIFTLIIVWLKSFQINMADPSHKINNTRIWCWRRIRLNSRISFIPKCFFYLVDLQISSWWTEHAVKLLNKITPRARFYLFIYILFDFLFILDHRLLFNFTISLCLPTSTRVLIWITNK